MSKRSAYAVALGLHAEVRATDVPRRPASSRNVADGFYFQLEAFLDNWRHQGVEEDVVRAALERARRTSLAMEDFGRRLKGW